MQKTNLLFTFAFSLLCAAALAQTEPLGGHPAREAKSSFTDLSAQGAPAAQQNQTLIINGQPGQAPVIQLNGRSYVDLEALARLSNGSLSFSGNQIILTLPSSSASAPAAAPSTSAPANPGFSKDFLTAGIEEMSTIREWHSALASAIVNQVPVAQGWLAPYQAQAMTNLRLAQVAARTDADQNAAQLIANVYQKMKQLSDKYVAKRANVSYIAPDALKNDTLDQSIIACGKSLGAMAASGQFYDDGSCH